jgi:hypothetical protein
MIGCLTVEKNLKGEVNMMDRSQVDKTYREMANFIRLSDFNTHKKEMLEHGIIWGIIPILLWSVALIYLRLIFGWWLPLIMGSTLFSFLWFADQRKTGNYFWMKRIAHIAISYIIASRFELIFTVKL